VARKSRRLADAISEPWLQRSRVAHNREEIISSYVSKGDVLDLGVVDSRRSVLSVEETAAQSSTGLHEYIRKLNPRVLGVDIDEQGVAALNQQGYNAICADVETMDLRRKFDTIVAGEIVEHLPNPGLSLRSLGRHLKVGGNLILTTPNPFFINQIWKIFKYGSPQVHEEHTMWFDPHTLGRLLRMTGFEIRHVFWLPAQHGRYRLRLLPARFRQYYHPNFLMVAGVPSDDSGPGEEAGETLPIARAA
jgi:SAM-dependent methyltransferase